MKYTCNCIINNDLKNNSDFIDYVKSELKKELMVEVSEQWERGDKIVSLKEPIYNSLSLFNQTEIRQYVIISDLVRCKNCRYYDPRNLWCFKFLEYMTGDDFCSKGTILE